VEKLAQRIIDEVNHEKQKVGIRCDTMMLLLLLLLCLTLSFL
jgi:hypothetical protein